MNSGPLKFSYAFYELILYILNEPTLVLNLFSSPKGFVWYKSSKLQTSRFILTNFNATCPNYKRPVFCFPTTIQFFIFHSIFKMFKNLCKSVCNLSSYDSHVFNGNSTKRNFYFIAFGTDFKICRSEVPNLGCVKNFMGCARFCLMSYLPQFTH